MGRFLFFCLFSALAAHPAFAEVQVEVLTVYYRAAADLVPELSKSLSEDGRMVAEPGSNVIVVRDWPQNIGMIKERLKAMDKRPRRVRITVGFVEMEKIAALSGSVKWFLTVGEWSQGSLPADLEIISGFNATPYGAARRMETFNRQLLLLDGDKDGVIYVSNRVPDSAWFLDYGIMEEYIDPSAQFRDFGASFTVGAKVDETGRVEMRLTPKLTRLDGGSDIPIARAYAFVLLDGGQSVLLAGNVEKEDGFGKRFLASDMTGGGKKEMALVLGAFAE